MAQYEEVRVSGFEEFNRAVEQHKGKTIFAYFTGSKDAGGKSWCPDCVQAEPVVQEGLKHVGEGCVFIHCQVGERPYWKDPNNDFRKNLKITAVPTLLKYGTLIFMVHMEKLKSVEAESNLTRSEGSCNHYSLPPRMVSFDSQIKVDLKEPILPSSHFGHFE
uniref:Thioredoxin domain-containing protein 17 n=1 Tax=Equus caballus TaxID=9796 RepID=A0A9L0RY71_HORSE